jgi:hypothetical protein
MFYEVPIIGVMKKADEGVKVRLLTPQLESALEREKEEAKVEKEDILAEIERIKAQIQEKVAEVPAQSATPSNISTANAGVKKNHRAVKPKDGRKYVLLSKSLADWGKVPQQQADLAAILAKNFTVGQEVSEAEVFATVTAQAPQYPSLAASEQHSTYLLAYYRGYDKKDGKHVGFIRRNFLRMIG